ncbi:MAG: hypothetical protein RR588_09965 [Solibacillus sp.]
MKKGINVEYGGIKINDALTKVGSLFGPKVKSVAEVVDKKTKNVTLKFDK